MAQFLAIDVGGTKIAMGIGNGHGKFQATATLPTDPAWTPDEVLKNIADVAHTLEEKSGTKLAALEGAGLGSPGPLDGSVLLDTSNLHGWKGLDWAAGLKSTLGLPVSVQNDATAAGLGEWVYGSGRGTQNCIYVTVSTGIGAGIIVDGELYSGSRGNAGEFGHIVMNPHGVACPAGHRGCLESMASGTAIARQGRERQEESDSLRGKLSIDTKDVFDGYAQKDTVCLEIIDGAADALGLGLSYLINLFNPDKIVLGGGVATHVPDSYRERVWQATKHYALPALFSVASLVPAELGEDSGLMGALAVAVKTFSRV